MYADSAPHKGTAALSYLRRGRASTRVQEGGGFRFIAWLLNNPSVTNAGGSNSTHLWLQQNISAMPNRNSYASSHRLSTATSGGRPSTEIASEESDYDDGGSFVGYVNGSALQERRRQRREEAEQQRRYIEGLVSFINDYRGSIIRDIATGFGKPVEVVTSQFDALPLARRYALASWASSPSPRREDRTLLYDGGRHVRNLLNRDSTAGNTPQGSHFRARHSFGPSPRRHQKFSELSVARITTAIEDVLRSLGMI